MVWRRGRLADGRVKWYIGRDVLFGYGASGRWIGERVVEKLEGAGRGGPEEGEMVLVERAPVVKACKVDRKVD